MLTLRASKTDAAIACPGVLEELDGYQIHSQNDLARLGTAVHRPLGIAIAGGDIGSLRDYAVAHDVPEKELASLFHRGMKLFGEVREYFEGTIQTELYHEIIGQVKQTGHIDVIGRNDRHKLAVVADHKSGYLDADHVAQGKTYGRLALDMMPEYDKVLVIFLRIRDYTRDQEIYTRAQLEDWYKTRVEPLASDRSLNPGGHCRFCHLRGVCPGYRDLVRSAAQYLAGAEATPKQIYDAIKNYEELIEQSRNLLADDAAANGGALRYDDIYDLRLMSQARQKILFGQALPILSQHLTAEEIASCVTVGKEALKEAIMDKTATGQKGKAVEGVFSQLDEAAALESFTITQLLKRKRDKE